MRLMLNDRCATMPWDAIDSVIFDVGNVLLAFQPLSLLHAILPDHEADYPALLNRVFHSPYWPMLDRGDIDCEEAVMVMSAGQPALRPLIDRVMRNWNNNLPTIEEGVAALRACKERGKTCYVLSNYSAGPFDETCRMHPEIFSLFDGFAVSARLHMTKPDPRIFHYALDEFRLNPERTLFIDDSAANIECALSCGMQAVWYDQPGRLSAFIR